VDEEFTGKLLMDACYTREEAEYVKAYKGAGCPACDGKGYKGRTGLYEVLEVTDGMRELIMGGASAMELRKKAIEQGMLTLRRSGLIKAAAGITTLEEVYRETVR
jgi:type IV pilus assembly protein PilB